MKITLENIGVLAQAELELGDMTIICGENNTGKTYATYALFGFLYGWERAAKIKIASQHISELLNEGVTYIDIDAYAEKSDAILRGLCSDYSKNLARVFASKERYFADSKFLVELPDDQVKESVSRHYESRVKSEENEIFSLVKEKGNKNLAVSLLTKKNRIELPNRLIAKIMSESIGALLFGVVLPYPLIASSERTGAAIFRKELDFARNRLLEEMSKSGKDIDPFDLLSKSYQDYALPVKINVDFTRKLDEIAKKDGFLMTKHPDILDNFADIIGGEYITGSNDTIYFKPFRKNVKLTMDESSSAVRSLLDIGFYLRHTVKPGDLLMIDEPELNLHPANQRRVARLLAQLVNVGIKVFITTHSDYLVKEINTLIMLHSDKPYLKEIARKEKYDDSEIISPDKIRVYIAEKGLVKTRPNQRRQQKQTLRPANITPEYGIEVGSFDQTIDEMNRIQDAIIWGDEA